MISICSINTYLDEMKSSLGCIKVQKMQFFIYFFIIFREKSLEAVTMATGMQPKELGINYLVLCDNTKTQKVLSKSMIMRAKLGLVVTENCYYSTDIVFLCRFSVWGVFPRRFRLVWQTVFLRFRLHRFVPFSIRKSVCVTDQSKAVTRRFLSLQKTSFTHAQILQTKTAFAETLFRQEPIRFT